MGLSWKRGLEALTLVGGLKSRKATEMELGDGEEYVVVVVSGRAARGREWRVSWEGDEAEQRCGKVGRAFRGLGR